MTVILRAMCEIEEMKGVIVNVCCDRCEGKMIRNNDFKKLAKKEKDLFVILSAMK